MRETNQKRRNGIKTGLAFWGLMVAIVLVLSGAAGKGGKNGPAGGDLLWDDQFNNGANNNGAFAITVDRNRVFAGGDGETAGKDLEGVVRAYDAKTGRLLWEDLFNYGGGANCITAITTQGRRVFAAGQGKTAAGIFIGIVRAYEATTGALLWEDQFGGGGKEAGVWAITVDRNRVFAAGYVQTEAGVFEWVVRAYESRTGTLLWADQFSLGGRSAEARAITVQGNRVFAGGFGDTGQGLCPEGGICPWVVRAYESRTGALLWEDQFDLGNGQNDVFSITAQGNRVFAAGFSNTTGASCKDEGVCELVVRAYEATTGALLWTDQFGTGEGNLFGLDITAQGNRVFAAGGGLQTQGSTSEWVVRAYEASTGALLWADQFDKGGTLNAAQSITAQFNRVFAAGFVQTGEGEYEWVVRAYEAKTGEILWDDQGTECGPIDNTFYLCAIGISGERNRVFAAGGLNEGGGTDWAVRAYSAR